MESTGTIPEIKHQTTGTMSGHEKQSAAATTHHGYTHDYSNTPQNR
jgi:hypothetical protein